MSESCPPSCRWRNSRACRRPSGKLLEKFLDIGASAKPLSGIKAELAEALAGLGTRIIVFIDDVDRLEPGEIVEVLRLVRSVADFPNVVYVLCYDPEVVAKAISRETGADGQAYLAKIVPITLPVPEPEPLSLQRMFTDKLKEIEPQPDHDAESRIYNELRLNPGRLRTPRDVNRVLDALRFLWPGLRGDVDFGDLVLLQLIRNANPALYKWLEAYCAYCAELESDAGIAGQRTSERLFSDLNAALALEGASAESPPSDLKEIAPPIRVQSSDAPSRGEYLSNPHQYAERAPLVADQRLASPDHYRLYFALSAPEGAPQAEDFERLRQALRAGSSDAADVLRSWFDQSTNYGASKAAVALKRLDARDFEKMTGEEARNLLFALGEVMDERAPKSWTLGPGPDDWYHGRVACPRTLLLGFARSWIFRPARPLQERRLDLLAGLHAEGGHRQPRRQPGPHLSRTHPQGVDTAFAERMDGFDWSRLVEARRPLLILDTWRLLGFGDRARELFRVGTERDEDFLTILEAMVQTVQTETGPVAGIPPSALELVVDRESARERLFSIPEDDALNERARSVWERIQDGERERGSGTP